MLIPNADHGACHYYKVTGQGAGKGVTKEKIDPMAAEYLDSQVYYLPEGINIGDIDEVPVPKVKTETVFNKVYNKLKNGESIYAIVNPRCQDYPALPTNEMKKKFRITKAPSTRPEITGMEQPNMHLIPCPNVFIFDDERCTGSNISYTPRIELISKARFDLNPDYIKTFNGKIFEHEGQFYKGTLSGASEKDFSLIKIAERQITKHSGVIYQADAGDRVTDPRNINKTFKVLVDGKKFDLEEVGFGFEPSTPPLFYNKSEKGFYRYDVATNKFEKVTDLEKKKASVTQQKLIVVNNIESLEGSLEDASYMVSEYKPPRPSVAAIQTRHQVAKRTGTQHVEINLSNNEIFRIDLTTVDI